MNATQTGLRLLLLIALAGAGYAALDRYLAWQEVKVAADRQLEDLQAAQSAFARHPGAFAPGTDDPGARNLKALVQGAVARNNVPVVFLSESERELGRGVVERDVTARAVNVAHGPWVRFLADLEANGKATVKELRMKPAPRQNGVYEEAETVVSLRWAAPEPGVSAR